MTNYMDGNWHDWHGGECPVPGDVEVDVEFIWGKGKPSNVIEKAKEWIWSCGDIIRFRVLNPQPNQTGPVRTVTRREIVPGVYGTLRVHVCGDYSIDASTASELTSAIENLTAIRDALADQETQE